MQKIASIEISLWQELGGEDVCLLNGKTKLLHRINQKQQQASRYNVAKGQSLLSKLNFATAFCFVFALNLLLFCLCNTKRIKLK